MILVTLLFLFFWMRINDRIKFHTPIKCTENTNSSNMYSTFSDTSKGFHICNSNKILYDFLQSLLDKAFAEINIRSLEFTDDPEYGCLM